MIRTIDFHSHILCGVDHGSRSRADSKAQIELMSACGTDAVVATSHFYPDRHRLEDFIEAVAYSQKKIAGLDFDCRPLDIYIGAEVLVCQGLEDLRGLESLCIRGTNCILLEMPICSNWSRGHKDSVESIINRGYTVVLAHIDRYIAKYEHDIDDLVSMGAAVQINASAFSGFALKRKMRSYIDADCTCVLGSDLHGTEPKRYRSFAALKSRLGKERFERVMRNSEELLKNAEPMHIAK